MRVQLKRFGIRTTARLGIAAIALLAVEPSMQAQILPPPPSLPATPSAPIPSVNPDVPPQSVPIEAAPNERVYTAPRDNSINSVQSVGRYRVFVENDSPFVLQRVRLVQPDAFIQNISGRRVIQVGTFNDEANARQQVSRLASQGVSAQITGVGGQIGNPQQGYYAVIPGNQFEVQNYRDRAIRLGISPSVVRIRNRPLGLHLAVGAFSDEKEAERVVRYLRDRGGMDARLYFNR